jgi:integrase/recombinase XerD
VQSPKSGKDAEVVFVPRKVVDRLRTYLKGKTVTPEQRIFTITCAAARIIVKKAGIRAGIELRPHDLRRHAATYAPRSGVPLETVSKEILDMPISPPFSGISGKSAIQKPQGGLKTCTDD